MCITQSVGKGGANRRSDVKTVQILLNSNIDKLTPLKLLLETGTADTLTIKAIETFQKRVLRTETPDGRVDPNGRTLKALRDGSTVGLTEASLQGVLIG